MSRKSKKKQNNQSANNSIDNTNSENQSFSNAGSNSNSNNQQDITLNYSSAFAKSYLTSSMQISDPFLRSMLLKDLNMNPLAQSKEDLLKLMQNPKQNEKKLRDFAEYLENTLMQFKRQVSFFGSILSFDYFIEPTNADEEDMKTSAFKKSYKKANDVLDKLNFKKQFPEIMKQVLRQEVVYCYVRETKDNIFLQEMPIDYCKIVGKTEYGYQYAFDASYFLRQGVSIENYDPVFKEYFESYKSDNKYKGAFSYWIDLDPIKAPCFKFDETVAGTIPPFMSMFPDGLDVADYREITKVKNKLDLYKIIINKIPMMGDAKVKTANNLAIDGTTAGNFSKVIENALPDKTYMKSITTPLDSEVVNLQRTENGSAEVDVGNKMFANSSGVNQNIFGGDSSTNTAIKTSLENATSFVVHMYPIFERFINVYLKMNTGRYRWKIHFEGTRYDREDRMRRAFQAAGGGFPKTFMAMAMGQSLETVVNITNLENSMDLTQILIPIQSTHTTSGNDNGRPEKSGSEISNAGEVTKGNDSNVR